MISKLIVWGENRKSAAHLALSALQHYLVHGISTNIEYLTGIIQHKAFLENRLSTIFCDEHTSDILSTVLQSKSDDTIALIGFAIYSFQYHFNKNANNIWQQIGYWRNRMEIGFLSGEATKNARFEIKSNKLYFLSLDGKDYTVQFYKCQNNQIDFLINGQQHSAYVSFNEKGQAYVSSDGKLYLMKRLDMLDMSEDHVSHSAGDGISNLFSPMPGKVIKVNVKAGDQVNRGTVMLVVEAMKMENNLTAEEEAVVEQVGVKVGDMVDTDKQLIFLKYIIEQ